MGANEIAPLCRVRKSWARCDCRLFAFGSEILGDIIVKSAKGTFDWRNGAGRTFARNFGFSSRFSQALSPFPLLSVFCGLEKIFAYNKRVLCKLLPLRLSPFACCLCVQQLSSAGLWNPRACAFFRLGFFAHNVSISNWISCCWKMKNVKYRSGLGFGTNGKNTGYAVFFMISVVWFFNNAN